MSAWFILFCKLSDLFVYCALLVPFVLAQQRHKQLTGGLSTLRFVPLFLFTIYVLMQISTYLWRYNIPLVHLNTIGETLLYLKVFYDEFIDRKTRNAIKYLSILFILFSLIDSLYIEGFHQINSYTNLAESTIIIALSLLFFEKSIVTRRKTRFQKIPMFIATIGIILYLSGTVVVYLTTNYFISTNDEYNARLMYLISSALLLLLSVLFCRAFLLVRPDRVVAS